jgi:alpha-tubulin suppressor-like RCC1 family protein
MWVAYDEINRRARPMLRRKQKITESGRRFRRPMVLTVTLTLSSVTVTTLGGAALSARPAGASVTKYAYSWGNNDVGELGNGTVTGCDGGADNSATPSTVSGLVGVKQLATGWEQSLALMKDGTVEVWGYDINGAYGNDPTSDPTSCDNDAPQLVPLPTTVKAVAVGLDFGLALLQDGTVMAWGLNYQGELGLGNNTGPDTICHDGACSLTPIAIPGLTGVTAIAAGATSGYAVLSNGTVESWGGNQGGQLGRGNVGETDSPTLIPHLSGVKSISANRDSAMVLLTNGTVKDWGAGSVGDGSAVGSEVPAKVSNLTGVTSVSEGGDCAMALLANGTVMGWGQDSQGVLGKNGGSSNAAFPIQIVGLSTVKAIADGDNFGLALLTSGAVEVWGDNSQGELGKGAINVPTRRFAPKAINGLSSIKRIAASGEFDFAIVGR